eukprot:9499417-Pyramimonas_sp.AAC.1
MASKIAQYIPRSIQIASDAHLRDIKTAPRRLQVPSEPSKDPRQEARILTIPPHNIIYRMGWWGSAKRQDFRELHQSAMFANSLARRKTVAFLSSFLAQDILMMSCRSCAWRGLCYELTSMKRCRFFSLSSHKA